MLDSTYDTKILSYWQDRPLRAHEAFSQIAKFLHRLQQRHPAFSSLYFMNGKGYCPIQADFSNLEAELVASMNSETRYINDDPQDDGFSMNCLSPHGFLAPFTNAIRQRQQTVRLSIQCGEIARPIAFRTAPDHVFLAVAPEVESPELLRDLFEDIVFFWRPDSAVVSRAKIRRLLELPITDIHPGWLTYIANPEVAAALPDDIVHQPYADGVLIQAAARPGREDDAEYVGKLRRIRDILHPLGLLRERRPHAT